MASILVVDDSPIMRKIVIRTLRQAGYGDHDIREAGDGSEALEEIRVAPPSVVLSDWNMPNMNGLDLLKTIRSENIRVPFGFVTSESNMEQKSQAAAAGASFLLSKPFTAEDLDAELRRIF
jgi:two-component system chemotaxis response regulator CheY